MKRHFSIFSIFILLFSFLFTATYQSISAEEGNQGFIVNGGFEDDYWADFSWTFEGEQVDDLSLQRFAYEQEQDVIPVEGDYSFNYWFPDTLAIETTFSLNQTVIDLPAGTYELTVYSMGEGASVQLFVGDHVSEEFETTGYNNWQQLKLEFELNETGSIEVGAQVSGDASSWGYLDYIQLEKANQGGSEPVESDIFVERVDGIPDDFINGVDISSILALEKVALFLQRSRGRARYFPNVK